MTNSMDPGSFARAHEKKTSDKSVPPPRIGFRTVTSATESSPNASKIGKKCLEHSGSNSRFVSVAGSVRFLVAQLQIGDLSGNDQALRQSAARSMHSLDGSALI